MAQRKEENQNVVFRRINGRIVPIVVGGAAVAGVGGAIAFERSRRSVVRNTSGVKIVKRESIFKPETKLTAFVGGQKAGFVKFANIKKKRRADIKMIVSPNPKASTPLLFEAMKQAKAKGAKTIGGGLTTPKIAEIVGKRGTLVSLSKTSVKKGMNLRRVGIPAAKGEITRLQRGIPRAIISGFIKLK